MLKSAMVTTVTMLFTCNTNNSHSY